MIEVIEESFTTTLKKISNSLSFYLGLKSTGHCSNATRKPSHQGLLHVLML